MTADDRAPLRAEELLDGELIVPIRSSSGTSPDPSRLPDDALRHGTDASGVRFIAAFRDEATLRELGPPGSDHVRMPARRLFERADRGQERVVVDPGGPDQLDISVGLVAFLAAGIDPNRPDALRARRPVGALPELEPPGEIPPPFADALSEALPELDRVERVWLLRAGDAWTAGIQLAPDALLGDFDAVRNRLHAIASEHLGSRRRLAVTDLRAASLREHYDSVAAPFYVAHRRGPPGLLGRLFGGG